MDGTLSHADHLPDPYYRWAMLIAPRAVVTGSIQP